MSYIIADKMRKARTGLSAREAIRRLNQVSRVCKGCQTAGFSPCQSVGLSCSSWCQGEHIVIAVVDREASPYCYPCLNKARGA